MSRTGEALLEEARELSFPRYPGSDGDRRAIEWLAARLADAAVEVERQAFSYDIRPAFRALRALLLGLALLIGLAGWLAARHPLAAALSVAAALAAAGSFLAWSPWLERIYRGEGPTRTENLTGWRRAAGRPRATLVFMAHHDSKSQNLTLPVRAGLTAAAIAGTLVLAGWLGFALLGAAAPGGGALAAAAGGVAAVALAVLATLSSGNRSPGGTDNAGSVAILLELARRLPGALPPGVELAFLSPGAEEDHMVGAMRWLDRHHSALAGRPVWTINVDGAGIPGRVALIERYGFGSRFSARLSEAARAVAGRLGLKVRGVWLPPALGVDTIPFAHRGLETITLATGSLGPAVLAVHSPRDVADHLDPDALERVLLLAEGMAHELAAEERAS